MIEPKVAIDRLRKAFGGPDRHRTLHAKGRFYAGTFTATPEAAALWSCPAPNGEPVPVARALVQRRRKRPTCRTRRRTSAAWP